MDVELVITVWDNRKAIKAAAKILRVRSDRVTVHIASVGGMTFRGLFIDEHQQKSTAAMLAMKRIQYTHLELPRRYRELVEPQEVSQ